MKFMGSKGRMIEGGLGEAIAEMIPRRERFVDLFTGSGSVAWHVAESYNLPVLACDLQEFATVIAASVICRVQDVDSALMWNQWSAEALEFAQPFIQETGAEGFEKEDWQQDPSQYVQRASALCVKLQSLPVTSAYGGHYFSPMQAILIDSLRATLPSVEPARSVALASLIMASSDCAAAPGHTAQPFKPTSSGSKYLFMHWKRDVLSRTQVALERLASRHALRRGDVLTAEATSVVSGLSSADLVFIDPPYSAVQYSRFYHVLETIAKGITFDAMGVGRYPPIEQRPQSNFSMKSRSRYAVTTLLERMAEKEIAGIVTFPASEASNGLSGRLLEDIAQEWFKVSSRMVNGRFSTLGGNSSNRLARVPAYELIMTLEPYS